MNAIRYFFRRSVDSTNLKWMAWHPLGGGTMAVEFRHGGTYTYSGVPLSTYRSLVKAHTNGESVGSAFHSEIKRAGYAYARLS